MDKHQRAIHQLKVAAMNIAYIPKSAEKVVIRDKTKTYIKTK